MFKCCEGPVRAGQLTPCPDSKWLAMFKMPDAPVGERPPFRGAKPFYWTLPVMGWIVINGGDFPHLHPMVPLSGVITDATSVDEFLGVAPTSDNLDALYAILSKE